MNGEMEGREGLTDSQRQNNKGISEAHRISPNPDKV